MTIRTLEAPTALQIPRSPDLPAAAKKPPRLPFIDGLRGVALLMVLVFHAWLHAVSKPIRLSLPGFGLDLSAPAYFGFAGVNLFIVLSGFCLTYPLAHGELRVQVGRFWRQRAWRIMPPYYAALALFVLLRCLAHRPTENGDIITHVLLIHSFFPQWLDTINGAWWFLALQAQLYLVFPLLVAGFRRWGVGRTLLVTLALSLAWRTWVWYAHDLSSQNSAYFWCYALPGRLFEFALGMTVVMLLERQRRLVTAPWQQRFLIGTIGCGALSVLVVTTWSRFAPVTDILWGLTFFSLLMYAATGSALGSPVFAWRPLAWVGGISYSVYLIHLGPVQQAAQALRPLGLPPLVTWLGFELVAVPLSLALGWLFYRSVESHFMGLCPIFQWPAALRSRFQGWFSPFK